MLLNVAIIPLVTGFHETRLVIILWSMFSIFKGRFDSDNTTHTLIDCEQKQFSRTDWSICCSHIFEMPSSPEKGVYSSPLCYALLDFQQGGIFIVLLVPQHSALVFIRPVRHARGTAKDSVFKFGFPWDKDIFRRKMYMQCKNFKPVILPMI